jgi:hypothetical protein
MHVINEQDGVLTVAVADKADLHASLKTLCTHRRAYIQMDGTIRYAVNREVDGAHVYQLPQPLPRNGMAIVDRLLNSLAVNTELGTEVILASFREWLSVADAETQAFGRHLIRSTRLDQPPGMR